MALTTYGELRLAIQRERLGWTVDPRFADNEPIERRAMGGDPALWQRADAVPRVDVQALVRAGPPIAGPLLDHLVLRGVVPPQARPSTDGAAAAGGTAPAGAGAPRPAVVDWRSRFGWPWITTIRDQYACEHCWIYAATALVEAQARIEHCVWSPRSVGDYIEANKTICGQCGDPASVLAWAAGAGAGMDDLETTPWPDRSPSSARSTVYWVPAPDKCGGGSMKPPPPYEPAPTRAGRTVRIPAATKLGNVDDQKNWLDTVGPLTCCFDVYQGFGSWTGSVPYKKAANATYQGGHCVLIVGYDDNLGAWIVKNSWGTGWGNAGFGLIAYGECKIDDYVKLGLKGVNVDPYTKRRLHAGGLLESGNGASHRNFELIAPSAGNGLAHWWRNNDSGYAWSKATTMGNDVADPPVFTSTSWNRNLEMVYRTTGGRLHHRFFDQGSQTWKDGPVFGPVGAQGAVGFAESSWGPGNFEVVVAVGGALQHWWRNPGFAWAAGATFGTNLATAGPSLLQSDYGALELIAVTHGGQMQHWWRNGAQWQASASFGSGIVSPPCMIQGQFGMADDTGHGNFELCVATPAGTVEHWWRNNQTPAMPWTRTVAFGSGIARVIGLVESSFGFDLQVAAIRTDGQLQHWWRDGNGWHAGPILGSTH